MTGEVKTDRFCYQRHETEDPAGWFAEEQEMGITIEKVCTENFELRFFRFGTGKTVFAIIPGLSVRSVLESAELIAEGYAPFTDDFTFYVFDRRSELPEKYTISEMAEDTAKAFRA